MEEEKINEVIKILKEIEHYQAIIERGSGIPIYTDFFILANGVGVQPVSAWWALEDRFGYNARDLFKRRICTLFITRENENATKYICGNGKCESDFRKLLQMKNFPFIEELRQEKEAWKTLVINYGYGRHLDENLTPVVKRFDDALKSTRRPFQVPKISDIEKWLEEIYEQGSTDEYSLYKKIVFGTNSDENSNPAYKDEAKKVVDILKKTFFKVGNSKPLEEPHFKFYGTLERSKSSGLAEKIINLINSKPEPGFEGKFHNLERDANDNFCLYVNPEALPYAIGFVIDNKEYFKKASHNYPLGISIVPGVSLVIADESRRSFNQDVAESLHEARLKTSRMVDSGIVDEDDAAYNFVHYAKEYIGACSTGYQSKLIEMNQ